MKAAHMIPILLAGTSLRILAQMPQGPPPDPVAMALDKNHDQELSSSEIKGAARSLLKLDKDRDKALSAGELRPEPPKGQGNRKKAQENGQMPPPLSSALLTAIDTDSSGDLSKEELEAASESLLTLDADQDGKISSQEGEITRPPGGGPGGGGPGNGGGPGRPPGPPPGGAR